MIGSLIAGMIGKTAPLTEIERAGAQHERMFWLSIVVILLAAAATAVVTYLVWRSGNSVQEAIRADADIRIAAANERGAQANERAGQADERAGLANERAGKLEVEAANQRERAEALSRDAEELKRQNLATETRLEEERRTRFRLERALAPRQFFIRLNPNNFDDLTPFAGTNAIINHAQDVEARRAADQIANLLRVARWNVEVRPDPDMTGTFFDGVVVTQHLPIPKEPWDPNMAEMRRLERASETVVAFLTAQGWAARTFPGSSRHPANTVVIGVGLKPLPAPTP